MIVPASPIAGPLAVFTQGLSKDYGDQAALTDVNLRIPEGGVYLLTGANGAGKTTLFKILLDLIRADAGMAEVLGLQSGGDAARVRAQIGYVAAEPGWLYSWMTVRRLMRHHAAFYPAWDEKYASHLAKRFALRLDQKFGTLSRGQARRTQLVLALAHRPPILLLDEPTDGLDRAIRDELMAIVADHMVESPTTILMSTHHVHEVDSLVDHLGVLHEGHLVVQVDRSRLHQKLRRYRADVPEDWEAPEQLRQLAIRRLGSDREIQWTVWGDEPEVIEQFDLYGAQVRDVSLLTLDEATLCFLKARHSSQLHEEDPPRKAASNRGRG